TRYEDTPQVETVTGLVPYQPKHFVDQAASTVLYRDGRELVETPTGHNKPAAPGLTTWGVFGPILSTVLLDAARSKLTWGHWEQDAAGLEAAFTFIVPKERSHYEVNYCCLANQAASLVAQEMPFRQLVGYHGELWI